MGNNKSVARLGVKRGEIVYHHHIIDSDGNLIVLKASINEENMRLMKKGNSVELSLGRGKRKKHYAIKQVFPFVGNDLFPRCRVIEIKIEPPLDREEWNKSHKKVVTEIPYAIILRPPVRGR